MLQTIFISLAVLLRIVSNPLANVFQKGLTARGHHPLVVYFLTYLLLSLILIPAVFFIHWPPLDPEFGLYSVLGGIAGALGNGFLVKALQKGELSVLGPINSYKSIISLILGIFLLGEVPGICGLLGILLIVYGSYVVLDTTEERFTLKLLRKKEIQFRIWTLVLTAVEAVFGKKIILASSVTVAFFGWCLFGALFSFLLMLVYQVKVRVEISKIRSSDFGSYLYLIGCIGVMQFTTINVLSRMQVGYALALFQLSTLFNVFLGYRIYQEKYLTIKLIGSVIMIIGSVLIILLNR